MLDVRALEGVLGLLDATGAAAEWIAVAGKQQRCSRAALQAAFLERGDGEPRLFSLGRDTSPAVDLTFSLNPRSADGFAVTARLPWDYLSSEASLFSERLGVALFERRIIYGRCHSLADLVEIGRDKSPSTDWEPSSIDEVYWLNWYGNDLVERLGRARVMSTPAHTLQALPDGSILWTTRPTPTDVESEEARIAQARARAHLVDGVPFEAELARLRDRSRRLALVEPAWDPALTPCSRGSRACTRPSSRGWSRSSTRWTSRR